MQATFSREWNFVSMDRPQERDLFICLLFSNQRIGLDFPAFSPFFYQPDCCGDRRADFSLDLELTPFESII